MSGKSERRMQDRRSTEATEASRLPHDEAADWTSGHTASHEAQRDESLRKRLADLRTLAPEAISARLPTEAVPLAVGPKAQLALLSNNTWSRPPVKRRSFEGLLTGLGASLAVGLLLVGWINRTDLMVALQSYSGFSARLFPSIQNDIGKRERVGVAIADQQAPFVPGEPQQADLNESRQIVAADARKFAAQPSSPRPSLRHTGTLAAIAEIDLERSDLGSPCGAVLREAQPGVLQLQLVAPARAGSSVVIKVDDLDYRASFEADGRLLLLAPMLAGAPTVRWPLPDGTPCSKTAAGIASKAQLRVALVWTGSAGLILNIVEPNAWLGSPTGHISVDHPNHGGTQGTGRMHAFGQANDPSRVQLYAVEMARLGNAAGVLSAVIELEPSENAGCPAAGGEPEQIRYQLYTLRTDGSDGARPDIRSLAFELPPCAAGKSTTRPVERIAIKIQHE